MDDHEFNQKPDAPIRLEVTRRTVIETGATGLLLTTLPRAVYAAGLADADEPPSPPVKIALQINGHPYSLALDPRTTLLDALLNVALNATHIPTPRKAMINTAIAVEITPSPRSSRRRRPPAREVFTVAPLR